MPAHFIIMFLLHSLLCVLLLVRLCQCQAYMGRDSIKKLTENLAYLSKVRVTCIFLSFFFLHDMLNDSKCVMTMPLQSW